jgi:hypothetical protein
LLETQPAPALDSLYLRFRRPLIACVLLALVLGFYLVPLFSDQASIQWDGADVHYSLQKYFSDNILHGKLPSWCPFSFSGMPLIADPEIGAWYPLNWPFFLNRITPRAIEWELALHAAIAALGAWLLASDLLENMESAALAGIFYAFSGFFTSHSSHVGIFQGAALFPWLLWAFRRAVLVDRLRYGLIAAAVGAGVMLAGHFQTALYCYFGLFLFAVSMRRIQAFAVLLSVMIAVVALSAVTWLPALELSAQSIRAHENFSVHTSSPLVPGALLTLFSPDHYGVLTGPYYGPADITQFYFYAGLLLPLLAIPGLFAAKVRLPAIVMLAGSIWYAFGPPAGLYLLIARLPGFSSVRAPVHIWFVAALSLALLAAAGGQLIAMRFDKRWIIPLLAMVAFGDVYILNMSRNPLAYARKSFNAAYGDAAYQFDLATQPARALPLHRFWAPADNNLFGPMNGALELKLEATYGYNPLQLQNDSDFMLAARKNVRLLNDLSVTDVLDLKTGQILRNPNALPRANVPAEIVRNASLASLNPATTASVPDNVTGFIQDPKAAVEITNYEPSLYRIRYTAASPSVLRISVPYFPGWQASVDGESAAVFPVDVALSGVVVPAGSHDLVFRFVLTSLTAGIMISLSAWMIGLGVAGFSFLAGLDRSFPSAAPRQGSRAR